MPDTTRSPFLLGVNYPWVNYGQDFGWTSAGHSGVSRAEIASQVAADFDAIRATGARVVRWFVFGDGRGGFLTDANVSIRPDDKILVDLQEALHLAREAGLQLCLSLMDFLWWQDPGADASPKRRAMQFPAGREAFLQSVLVPIFRAFRADPAILAWEVANEPEWAIHEFNPLEPKAQTTLATFRAFATEMVSAIHDEAQLPATLGSARLIWLNAWDDIGLDLYQAHYYPALESDQRESLRAQLDSLLPMDRPLWLGELPARDPKFADYSLEASLQICLDAGAAGAAVWRWRKPSAIDTDIAIGAVDASTLQAWLAHQRQSGEISA